MPNARILRNNFSGGEVSPELFGRMDIAHVANALATCRNFIIMPHGVASNRPGTQYVNQVKNSANATRLIQFSFSNTQNFAVEMGAGYFRFHALGATLLAGTQADWASSTAYVIGSLVSSGGLNYYCKQAHTNIAVSNSAYWYVMPGTGSTANPYIYEIPNPYLQADLQSIHYVQSGDIVTLVHPNYPPMELSRYSNTNWVLSTISFASKTLAPTSATAVATTATAGTPEDFKYQVTALNSLGYEESPASNTTTTISNDLTITGNFNTITWSAVTGAIRYNIYKYAQGTYAFIGQTSALTFTDANILADMTRTIPQFDPLFNSTGNYPATVAYYQQRRYFAGTNNQPMNVWATQPSSNYNMNYSIPSQDSDALRFSIAAQRSNSIRHLIPGQDLLLMTGSTEWRITNPSGGAITASTLAITPQAQNGTTTVTPVQVNNFTVYPSSQGGHIRELSYQWQSAGYLSNDLCLLAKHLFDYNTISDMCFSRSPTPIVWVINNSGTLLGLTYVPEQQVAAWHKHDTTNGVFESCVTITENNQDALYVVVKRVINGQTVRYVEVLNNRYFATQADAFFVDCGMTYTGVSATTLTGLSWLEGQTVSILGDGAVMPQQVVTGGSITLPFSVSKAQIGLPITADLQTPPMVSTQDPTMGQSRVKSINKSWVRVYNSGPFSVGPDTTRLTAIKGRHYESPGTAPALMTDEIPLFVLPNYNQAGEIVLRQADPLPLTIVDITVEAAIGG